MPTAIITGATKGIGKAIADKLLQKGFDIAICARSQSDLEDVKAAWAWDFPKAKIVTERIDISVEADIKKFAECILNTFDNIDILVNNAGVYMPGNIADEPDGQLEMMLRTNVLSAYHLTRAVLPTMKERKKGHIFNIASIAGLKAYPGGGAYSISKFALLGFSENMRYELMDDGIKVTTISPGAVWSNSWSGSGVDENRIMKAEDIADVLWSAYKLSSRADVEHIILRPQLGDL